ncbi:VOC family protein [Mucilaginibacter lappiensis]|uniref:3-demethylubiquinone-9 3-methyltransferase (Glyoxalase superfamily) n=1 Tax=Mucilaginibacter lappiensis TaxID=354630 RepID=A0A1N6NF00_9SPHI|nr:VOC family protein [Mucilaginibacter lappiensis]MBB6107978.1 putative 3-demethylubiquinone-9 3-methyltransferase (glyoxalase superfamily) [Mucilaginibacter lappiensis]MBB6125951.1 putative 3-demethylubiquinone-9 3-methyltransferase (glyoxalase superfamily) [Mucilaginibacter lappiensis]SIP90631.1 Glyoxalase superfamily enzyme, possibly 3-demethylubiquinone-9 3-methyltransferase [Mucilaginibacter lappiensis]
MQKITTCLWFDGKDGRVQEAIDFYTSIFKNSKILDITYYGEGHPQLKGQILVARFVLDGQELMILNGGPGFPFTEAISLSVDCKTQEEINFYWNALLADGGKENQCGWLKDKFGLSWQVATSEIEQMLKDKDTKKANNVMMAMMQMVKIDIQTLRDAYMQA